jgi:methionine-rich copper-binding protein CopC
MYENQKLSADYALNADFYLLICVIHVICGSILLLTNTAAYAHAQLLQASPAPGAQLVDSPAEIRLTFSEPLLAGSRITVYGQNFSPTIELAPEIAGAELFAAVPPLEPGDYTVQWTAVSQDGHPLSGSYTFTLIPANGSWDIFPLWLLALLILLPPIALLWRRKYKK